MEEVEGIVAGSFDMAAAIRVLAGAVLELRARVASVEMGAELLRRRADASAPSAALRGSSAIAGDPEPGLAQGAASQAAAAPARSAKAKR